MLYYGARYYDAALGRFIQPDMLVLDLYNPQDLNRYTYTRNNPLRYTDPSGRVCVPCVVAIGIVALKVADYGWTAWDAWQSGQVLADPHASPEAKAEAASNLAMTAAFELAEPDDWLPIALPLDDLARAGLIGGLKKAGKEGGEEASEIATKGFANSQKLSEHFRKHGAELGFKTEEEYLSAAQRFVASKPSGDVLIKTRAGGDTVIYNKSTDEFAVVASDGTIRTYFKPDPSIHGYPTNLDYFIAQ